MSTQLSIIDNVLNQEQFAIKQALPSHIKPEQFMQVCYTAAMLNPDLYKCTHSSLANSFIRCAKDGLVPDGREAAIVVYTKKQGQNWIQEAQYQPMIDGVLKRLRQSGEVPYITSKVVYKDDHFDTGMGIDGEYLEFKPDYNSKNRNDEDIKLVFAMAKLKNGEPIIEVMTREEVEKIMYLSKSAIDKATGKVKEYSVWGKFFGRMAQKTVLHRASKRLPNSSEVMEMLERDIQIQELRNGTFEAADVTEKHTHTVAKDQMDEINALVKHTDTNIQQMLAFVSSASGRVITSCDQLETEEASRLIDLLNKKMSRKVAQQREAELAAQNQAHEVFEGELMDAMA